MQNKLTLLGSGSCNIVPNKMAASVLLQLNGKNIVYDFGRGTAIRLSEISLKQVDITTVILSHLHPDHVTDLLPFLHAASWSQIDKRSSDITIYGQPGTEEFVSKLLSIFGTEELSRGFSIKTVDISPGPTVIEGIDLEFIDLHHSFGIEFSHSGKQYAVMADSSLHNNLINALQNVDLGIFDSGHLTDTEIVELAVKSQAKQLVCSHQYRELNQDKLNATAQARGYTGQLIVGHDLMEFDL